MDIISFNEASTANERIQRVNANPDSDSGVLTVPSVIASGETITIPAGRVAVLPNLTVDGTLVVDGDVYVPSGGKLTEERTVPFIASQGQTEFIVDYPVGFVHVHVNGIKLLTSDYTATNGTSVVLNEGLNAKDDVEITMYGTFEVANTYSKGEADALLADKADVTYVDGEIANIPEYNPTPTIATGSATFTNTDNNIALTGIGVGVEVGDVLQISGSTNNDTEFTVEVITDDNNVIVNQAHAGGTTTKSLVDETATVTVKLLAKWYNAPSGLGQGWVDMTSIRSSLTIYHNITNRDIEVIIYRSGVSTNIDIFLEIDGNIVDFDKYSGGSVTIGLRIGASVQKGSIYKAKGLIEKWSERR